MQNHPSYPITIENIEAALSFYFPQFQQPKHQFRVIKYLVYLFNKDHKNLTMEQIESYCVRISKHIPLLIAETIKSSSPYPNPHPSKILIYAINAFADTHLNMWRPDSSDWRIVDKVKAADRSLITRFFHFVSKSLLPSLLLSSSSKPSIVVP
jgi:hypothetical protein